MYKSFYSSDEYKNLQSEIMKRNWKKGSFNFLRKPLEKRVCKNSECNNIFEVKPGDPKVYCSQSCSAHINNKGVRRNGGDNPKTSILRPCIYCNKISGKPISKYCSIQCQKNYQYEHFIMKWKTGEISGEVGIETRTISLSIRKYLINKFGGKCCICGWGERNPVTGKVPIEVDHIDGNSHNNKEENLRVICPNCHSLSVNYKNLNKGHGRTWRMKKIKSSSAN